MKRTFLFLLISFCILSCSNNKKERNELLMKLTKENGLLIDKLSTVTKQNKEESEKMSAHILNMANAGASKNTIDSLMKVKEEMTAKQMLKLKEIENQQNRNKEIMDSILAISK